MTRRKAGKESCKQNVRYIKEPVTDHGYSTLYDCQQRNTDGIGVDNHLDVVHYMLCIGFAERKYFADVFLHPLSAYQHKVKYEYQNEKVDCKATDAAHDELPYGRKCGDNKRSGILAQYVITGFFLDDICCTFNRSNNTLRVEVDIL